MPYRATLPVRSKRGAVQAQSVTVFGHNRAMMTRIFIPYHFPMALCYKHAPARQLQSARSGIHIYRARDLTPAHFPEKMTPFSMQNGTVLDTIALLR